MSSSLDKTVSYIFPDFRAVDFLKRDFDGLVDQGIAHYGPLEVKGYEIYLVEQWILERKIGSIITAFTGDSAHVLKAIRLVITKNESIWPVKFKRYLNELIKLQHAKLKSVGDEGYLFVTNLASFYSNNDLNIRQINPVYKDIKGIPFPVNYSNFETNFNLKRFNCGGRSALLFSCPPKATEDKFSSMYKIDVNVPISYSVKELVMLVQVALYYFDAINPIYCDGILCNKTEEAIHKWWETIGKQFFGSTPKDGILGPKTVAAILSVLLSCKLRLNLITSDNSKDPFDIISFKMSIYHFQKSNCKQKQPSWLLDDQTFAKLISITNDKLTYDNILKFKKAVNKTVNDISGRGSRINNVSIETTNIDELKLNLHGKRLDYLFLGKGHPSSLTNALLDIYHQQKKYVNKESKMLDSLSGESSNIPMGSASLSKLKLADSFENETNPSKLVSASSYINAFKNAATQRKQKINDSKFYPSKREKSSQPIMRARVNRDGELLPLPGVVSGSSSSHHSKSNTSQVSTASKVSTSPSVTSLARLSESSNVSLTPKTSKYDDNYSNNPIKSGVERIRNLHTRSKSIPLKILTNEDEYEAEVLHEPMDNIVEINVSPKTPKPGHHLNLDSPIHEKIAAITSPVQHPLSLTEDNHSFHNTLMECIIERDSYIGNEDKFISEFNRKLNRRTSFPFIYQELNSNHVSYDYDYITTIKGRAEELPLKRSYSMSTIDASLFLWNYPFESPIDGLASKYIRAKARENHIADALEPAPEEKSSKAPIKSHSSTSLASLNSVVAPSNPELANVVHYIQLCQVVLVKKIDHLVKGLSAGSKFSKLHGNKIVEIDSLASKLKYEVRVLKTRVREVQELSNELDAKVEGL